MRVRTFIAVRFVGRRRHELVARVEIVGIGADRDGEVSALKRTAQALIESALESKRADTWSCEQWALYLWRELGAMRVEVSENGENGAFVESDPA